MSIPDFQTLMLPVLKAAVDGEVRISDVVNRLASDFSLTLEERANLLPSGRQTTFANRVHWAKSYLGKAGLITLTRRAHFRITDKGREVLVSPPERIDIRFLGRFPDFQRFRDSEVGSVNSVIAPENEMEVHSNLTLTPDEVMRRAHRELEAALADDLIQRIRAGSPAFFENVVVRLLIAMGYGGSVAEIDKALIGGSGDGGVDGVIDQDPLGLDRIYVQAKRYGDSSPVGSGAIRDFFGSLDRFRANKGLFVTTSSFSSAARETADLLSKRIVLIDGQQFARLMIRHDVGCRIEEILHVKKIDEEFFEV
jgi:restriction system protein